MLFYRHWDRLFSSDPLVGDRVANSLTFLLFCAILNQLGKGVQNMGEQAKKRKKVIRTVLIAAVSVCFAIVLLLSPLFAVRNVTVSDMVHYQKEDLTPFLDDVMHRNGFLAVADQTTFSQSPHLFSLEMPGLADRILFELPYLESVTVRYSFPSTVDIQVTERTASFLMEHYGIYLLIDTHGVVLETFTKEDCPEMPIVKGIQMDSYKIGVSISQGKDAHIDAAIRVCNMMQQLSMETYIDIIDVTDYNDIKLYCAPSLTILFGDSTNVGVRLTELKGILNGNLNGESNGVLDMRSGGHPVFTKNETMEGQE